MTREDAMRALAALLVDAARVARVIVDRDDAARMAAHLVRYAPAEGLSIRLDDGSEFPPNDGSR